MNRTNSWTDKGVLIKLRKVIPFLTLIPDNIYFSLDSSSFFLPEQSIITARNELESKMNAYVMTYKRGIFNLTIPVKAHLCAVLKGANLSKSKLKLLNVWEERYKANNLSFVIYKNPLQFVPYTKSLLYKYYLLHDLPVNGMGCITYS